MGLQEEFEEYAEKAKTLPENTTNENKLILYGLYKQATVGPVSTSRPGIFNMRDRAKWDAWKAVEASSTSGSSESRRIIQSKEITIEDFTKHLGDWKIPSISQSQIYKKSKYDIFKTDFTIKTEERDIQLTKPFETIQLLTQKSLQKHLDRNYKYIHIGCVQVGIKPLTKEGLNTSILAVLQDARFTNFEDSLLSSIESSLCSGPVSFNCYPNLTVSLKDRNILQSMQLQIKTHNYHMLEGPVPVALIFKIHYKAMFSAFASKHLHYSNKGATLLLQTDLSKANIVVPKAIQWKDITLPEEWILEGATLPQPIQRPQPNVQIRDVTQYADGKVRLSFHRHSTSSRITEESSSSNTIDLGRISKIPSVINIPYHINPPRHSTSDIPYHINPPRDGIYIWAGKSKEEAMNDYITKVKQLLEEAAASA